MEIKKLHCVNTKTTERKKEALIPPKRSFHETMIARNRPKQDQRKSSVFDMASKKEKPSPSSPKKNLDQGLLHREVQSSLTSIVTDETLATTSISELTPEIAHLMEKMANFIHIESQNGVTTTSVIVDIKGSALDGAQITLDHYDTAPHSFNLQLSGSAECMNLFTTHLTSLQTALQTHQSLQGFQVHILPPTLNEQSDSHLRGKDKKGQAMGGKKPIRVPSKKKTSF